jgi:cell division septation protein DedD
MNETPSPETDSTADTALKRRLLNRIAVAAVVMVGLLGSLAIFDALNAPEPAPAKMAAAPEPAPPKEEVATQEKPAEPAAAPAAEAKPEPAQVARAGEESVPEGTASPGAPSLQPLPPEKRLTKPATGRTASMRPSEPVPSATSPAARPDPARELAQAPTARRGARPHRGRSPRPANASTPCRWAYSAILPTPRILRAKLELNGIPSSIEARVHAGPFKTREEAELARAKLKELGLDGGLLLTLKK